MNLNGEELDITYNSAAIGGGIFYEILIPDLIKLWNESPNKTNKISDN